MQNEVNFKIREISIEDAKEYSRLRLEALQSEPEAFTESPKEFAKKSPEEIEKQIGEWQQIGGYAIGAFDSKAALIGMTGVYRYPREKTKHRGKVWGVYVTPEARAIGISRQILKEIIRRAQESEDIVQIELKVGSNNTRAYKLYESLGFKTCGQQPRTLKVGNNFIDEHLMVLKLR